LNANPLATLVLFTIDVVSDHIPPPLLQQLAPGGIMVILVGPPGAQHVVKAVKTQTADGFAVSRSDIYNGAIIPFVPFTGGHQT